MIVLNSPKLYLEALSPTRRTTVTASTTETTTPRRAAKYTGIRTIMESPILDERKWAKVPDIPADSFMLDLEDSAPPASKDAARAKVAEYLVQPEYFRHKVTLARPNHISTPWGREDLAALGEAGVSCLAYPKISRAEELDEVLDILRGYGADPDIFAIVETAESVMNLAEIAAHPNVVGLMFGPGDLSVDSGIPLFSAPAELNAAMVYPKVKTVLAGAANNVLTADIAFLANIKDAAEAEVKYKASRALGFTTGITFYPPHVPIINRLFGPSEEQIAGALEDIDAYESALSEGRSAVTLDSGRVLLVHDYEKALTVRDRATAIGLI
ncbi:hypothetical protein EEB14_51110 [Rhodococcus sp. WS4]|nr:hypothetical protein EEB14_51110 [Rhodococcus sp. WS4]